MPRKRNLFDLASDAPYPLSRSKIESFVRCKRCFYLDRRLGIGQPPTPGYTLNNAVDQLLKKEFDQYRTKGEPHPLMESHGINAVPFQHPDLEDWRNNRKGIRFLHTGTNFIVAGAIDDVWQKPDGELIVADYKATSTSQEITLDGRWKQSYKRQLDVYQWLLRQNEFKVSDIGWFVYCNALKTPESFEKRLQFEITMLSYTGNDSWVERTISKAHNCLMADEPPPYTEDCDYCVYRRDAAGVENTRHNNE